MSTIDIYAIVDEIDAQDAMTLGIDDVSEFFMTEEEEEVVPIRASETSRNRRSQEMSLYAGVDRVISGRASSDDSFGMYDFSDR